jgi:hypothetical protein
LIDGTAEMDGKGVRNGDYILWHKFYALQGEEMFVLVQYREPALQAGRKEKGKKISSPSFYKA